MGTYPVLNYKGKLNVLYYYIKTFTQSGKLFLIFFKLNIVQIRKISDESMKK